MIENIRSVGRDEKVSSQELRDLDDSMIAAISSDYHRLRVLLGKVRTLSTCLRVTNAAYAQELRLLEEASADSMTVKLTATSTPVYPSSLSDAECAENHPEFGIIAAKRLNTALVFTDETDEIRPTITLSRTSTTGVTEQVLTAIENSIDHCLVGTEPYLYRFVGETITKANLTINIFSNNKKMNINALRFIPMPSAGNTSLSGLRYDVVSPVVMNGNMEYPVVSEFDRTKSYPAYLHFKPVQTNLLKIDLNSNLFVAQLQTITIGVTRIVGEYNAYAKKSYIGYEIPIPEGATKLVELSIYADSYALSVLNTRMRVYSTLADFNNVTSNSIASSAGVQPLNVSVTGDVLYGLLEITSVDNTTPCIGKIIARFA